MLLITDRWCARNTPTKSEQGTAHPGPQEQMEQEQQLQSSGSPNDIPDDSYVAKAVEVLSAAKVGAFEKWCQGFRQQEVK